MSRDWTPEELRAASDAMEKAGEMSFYAFSAEIAAMEKIGRFAERQRTLCFPCPRCGNWTMDTDPARNALSRRADVYVCDVCGMKEALEDAIGKRTPLSEWDIMKSETWPL